MDAFQLIPGHKKKEAGLPASESLNLYRSLDLFAKRCESGFVVYGHIGEYLSIQFDIHLVESIDKATVIQAILAGTSVNAGDPEFSEITFFIPAIAISVSARFHDSLIGDTKGFALVTKIASGLL